MIVLSGAENTPFRRPNPAKIEGHTSDDLKYLQLFGRTRRREGQTAATIVDAERKSEIHDGSGGGGGREWGGGAAATTARRTTGGWQKSGGGEDGRRGIA
ncbi:hypothetical protein PIB30_050312 [Stylosanthes scabra]|uniref:Uncharacterized protein n=1 Tax=Stylosanthes scabra TaxID=79078 RepID=A0ABU6RHZ8_9FABA|nr:hypothetical protein [Stylosanthes scabra]